MVRNAVKILAVDIEISDITFIISISIGVKNSDLVGIQQDSRHLGMRSRPIVLTRVVNLTLSDPAHPYIERSRWLGTRLISVAGPAKTALSGVSPRISVPAPSTLRAPMRILSLIVALTPMNVPSPM
jgi:hypothetical protein